MDPDPSLPDPALVGVLLPLLSRCFWPPCPLVVSSFLSVAHVDFCFLFAYIFNLRFLCYIEHGQNLKFPPIQAVHQKLGFGIEREVKNTFLPRQKLCASWETLSNLSKREGLTLTIFKCSCWQFIFRKPPCVRYMGLTASCRWHVGFLELYKGKLRMGLGLTSVDLTVCSPSSSLQGNSL